MFAARAWSQRKMKSPVLSPPVETNQRLPQSGWLRELSTHDLGGQPVAEELCSLNQDDDDKGCHQGDFPLEGTVAVDNREVTQAAAADVAGHRGHINHTDEEEGVAQDQWAKCFRDDDGGDDSPRTCTHGAGSFNHARVNGDQVL